MEDCYRSGLGQVQVPEGTWEKERKRIGTRRKSFGAEGRRNDLASTHVLRPHAHSVLFWKANQTEKETGGNRSRYSDWRYRWKQLDICTNYVFHLEQVWKDGEWGTYIK